jgi:hypothetical protein
LSWCEVVKYSLFILGVIGGALGAMIGLLFWILASGLANYAICWSVIFLLFVAVLIVLFFFGGKSRIKEEKRLVIEQQMKHEKIKEKKRRIILKIDPFDMEMIASFLNKKNT